MAAESLVIPVPDCATTPVPEITPDAVTVPAWVKLTAPEFAMVFETVAPVARFSSSVAPEAVLTALVAAMEPAVPLPTCSVPALTVVAPVYVLALSRLNVPLPALLIARVPEPFWMTPLNVVEALLPPVVRVIAPAEVLVTVPADESEPIVADRPPRSSVAPPATITSDAAESALAEPALMVPALIVVVPVWVFAPDSVRVPVPFCTSETAAAPFWIDPEKVVEAFEPPVVRVAEAPLLVTVPEPANDPITRLVPARSKVPQLVSPAEFAAPKADSAPTATVRPDRIVVAPEYVLLPVSSRLLL